MFRLKILKFIAFLLLITQLNQQVFAQTSGNGDFGTKLKDDSARDLLIVAGSVGVGALLGLSTLSFSSKPYEDWRNIVFGGAIGIIVGVAVVVYMQASKNHLHYSYSDNLIDDAQYFSSIDRTNWHFNSNLENSKWTPSHFNFSVTF